MNTAELLSLSTDFLRRRDNLKRNDITGLREVIREHNRLYYQDEMPILSDTEYDELFHALARAEADYDMLDETSPTAHLAILASEQFQKVRHQYPMISLDNTYNVEEVREWNERMLKILTKSGISLSDEGQIQNKSTEHEHSLSRNHPNERGLRYYVQPKYDGLGLAVIYEYGKFVQAVTRGSGVEGEDVTLTALEIKNLPKEIYALRMVARMEVRGEVMMSRTVFDRVNRERLALGEKLFANPRNCASGSLRQLDPLVTRSRNLHFFAYAIPQIEQGMDSEKYVTSYHEMMDILSSWGFEREDFSFKSIQGIDELSDLIERETQNYLGKTQTSPNYFDFDIDGMVLKLDNMLLWDDLGRTEHHPRYAIAYKFPAKQVRTRVISIEHSVGRTGIVTPVANLEPVEVTGVIVKRATLHNYDELEKKGVREGDYVFVMRAGEVIPEIVSVISELRTGDEREIQTPRLCPVCMTPLTKDEGKVALFCPNPHCPAKIQGQLEMFVSKQGMNIDGLGEKQIELFLELGWITSFASVYRLALYRHEMLTIEGYKEKSIQNLLDAIENSRHTTLDRVFTAIGIPNVGKKTAKIIMNSLFGIANNKNIPFLEAIFSLTEAELIEVKDIGPETARSFAQYMFTQRESIEDLFAELDIKMPEQSSSPRILGESHGKIVGKSFCVTGSFDSISRDAIHEMIEQNGGEVRTSVSSKLDYLIAGEHAGSKKLKAEELGIPILSIADFFLLIA